MSKASKFDKKSKTLVIKFDENDRINFLKEKARKRNKKKNKKFLEKKKNEEKRLAKLEKNRIVKENIEKRYEELKKLKKDLNKYADISDDEEESS